MKPDQEGLSDLTEATGARDRAGGPFKHHPANPLVSHFCSQAASALSSTPAPCWVPPSAGLVRGPSKAQLLQEQEPCPSWHGGCCSNALPALGQPGHLLLRGIPVTSSVLASHPFPAPNCGLPGGDSDTCGPISRHPQLTKHFHWDSGGASGAVR